MGKLSIQGITHWAIPVNNMEESVRFYGDILGLENRGQLGRSNMTCFGLGDTNILLCERKVPVDDIADRDDGVHYSFNVSPQDLYEACKLFEREKVPVVDLHYREGGHFPGRELYFLDPSGNRLELRDVSWEKGMPEPSFEEIVQS